MYLADALNVFNLFWISSRNKKVFLTFAAIYVYINFINLTPIISLIKISKNIDIREELLPIYLKNFIKALKILFK